MSRPARTCRAILPSDGDRVVVVSGLKPGETVLVTWRAIPKSITGPWTVYYYPGEEVVTHLTKRSNGATYASTWLNAKSEIVKTPDKKDLPTTPGDTAMPPEEPQQPTPL